MALSMDALERYQTGSLSESQTGVLGGLETVAMIGGGVLGTVHGYKRYKGSFWGTTLWGVFGAFVPPLAIPVMLIQGFGKPAE